MDPAFWNGKKVFLTGHTGFKGAWASLLLHHLGATVYGYALPPEHPSAFFVATDIGGAIKQRFADIRDFVALSAAISEVDPHVIIHMAAQALVRPSYVEPVKTFATNVMGTVHVLEAARYAPSVKAVLIVTSDKCYENRGSQTGFREEDRLGGDDPYSNSKACAELVTDSYRRSFYSAPGAAQIASARAGNVFGGGDCAQDRLVPDATRAFTAREALRIRNPNSVRPWQHVLDPIFGYLTLVEKLVEHDGFAESWNFGPNAQSEVPVSAVVSHLIKLWGDDACWVSDSGPHPHEADYLRLNCEKARTRLGWLPRLDLVQGLNLTVDWHKALNQGRNLRQVSIDQLDFVLNGDYRQAARGSKSDLSSDHTAALN